MEIRHSRPLIGLWVALVVIALSLAASAQEVRYITWVGGASKALEDEVVDMFRDRNPDIPVDFATVSGGTTGVLERIVINAASDGDVDMALTHTRYLSDLISQDMLLDLRPYIERDGIDLSAYPKGVMDSYLGPNGEIYAFPQQWTTIVLGYNKDQFDRYGVVQPDNSWDIFAMEESARRLTSDTDGDGQVDIWGLHPQSLNEYVWRLWGVPFLDESGSRTGWSDSKAVDAWHWYGELYQSDLVPPSVNGADGTWVGGKVAMRLGWPHTLMQLAPHMNDSWDVAMHPYGANGQRVSRAAGAQWAILKSSQNPDQAWELMKFLISTEAQHAFLLRGRGGIEQNAMIQHWVTAFDPANNGIDDPDTLLNRDVMVEAYAYASLERQPIGYNQMLEEIVNPMAAKLRNGEGAAGTLVPEAARLIDARLAAQ